MLADPVRFDRFVLLPRQRRLLVEGQPASLGARAFDLLLTLAARPGHLLTKSELLAAVWPDTVVEEANLTVQVASLRKVLGSELIATIPGHGYRFTGQLRAIDARPAAPPSPPEPAAAATAPAGALIGRDADLARLRSGLAAPGAVVTLTGPAGVGKTSLARAAASGWADGALWVDLAPLTEAPQVVTALARALALPLPAGDPAPPLLQALGARLLVLDNAEHLVDAVAALLLALRTAGHATPTLRVLATCQLPLGVVNERVLRLEPLGLPSADDGPAVAAAVALFCERARAADHRFDPANAPPALLHAVCRQLDGLPLALEMAAARVRALGLQGLHDALAQRFAVLTRGLRSGPDRHRTLHAALDWSHGLLAVDEQRLFHALGVFAGGFTLDLAVAVGGADGQDRWSLIDTLATLVDRSLVATDAGDPPRYRLLETLRAYALEQLQRSAGLQAAQHRHALALERLFTDANVEPRNDAQRAAALAEHDNAREALAWAREHAPALALRLACAISGVATYASWRAEALQWLEACEPLLDHAEVPDAARVAWWNERARQLLIGRHPHARAVAAQALALCRRLGDAHGEFLAGVALVRATTEPDAGLMDLCKTLEALHDAHPAWQPRATRLLAGTLAVACGQLGDWEGQLRHRRSELALAQSAGLKAVIDATEGNIVSVLHNLGRHDEALQANEALLQRLQDEDSVNVAYACYTRLSIHVALHRHDAIRATARSDSALMRRFRMPYFADRWALMLAQEGRHRAAARIAGLALRLHDDFDTHLAADTQQVLADVVALADGAITTADREALMAEGQTLDEAGALDWVLRKAPDA